MADLHPQDERLAIATTPAEARRRNAPARMARRRCPVTRSPGFPSQSNRLECHKESIVDRRPILTPP